MFKAAKGTRLYEDIVNQFKLLIQDGAMGLGFKLPSEPELAERFGVSRVTVREALRIMEILGMVKTFRGKGTIVIAASAEEAKKRFSKLSLCRTRDLSNLLEVREIVEPQVAAHAARDASKVSVTRMEKSLVEMIQDIEKGGEGVEGAVRFHYEIIRSVKNDILSNLMESIMAMIEQSTHITLNLIDRPRLSYLEHREILEAIKKQDQDGAREAMRRHPRKVSDQLGLSE